MSRIMNCHLKKIKGKPVEDEKGGFSMVKIKIRKRQNSVRQFLEIYIYNTNINEKENSFFYFLFLLLKKKDNI